MAASSSTSAETTFPSQDGASSTMKMAAAMPTGAAMASPINEETTVP